MRWYKMRIEVDIQFDFYCEKCGKPMCDNVSYDKQRSIIRIEPCENCLEQASREQSDKV